MSSTPIPFTFPSHTSRGVIVVESAPFYQALQPPIPKTPFGEKRADEQLAEDIKLRLHIDSLPLSQSIRLHEYSIPSCGIRWDVLDKNVTALLGEEAYLWNTHSRPESGWYTMYATRPLTVSQINDLKVWSQVADEDDRVSAENSRRSGRDGAYQAQERELIRLERVAREARDQERWRKEKRRREREREIAWEERRREEWRRYYRQRAIAEEEVRMAERMKQGLVGISAEDSAVSTRVEDDEDIPDEDEWRKTVLRKRFRSVNRWGISSGRQYQN